MAEVTFREGLGRPLTYSEADDNFRFVEEQAIISANAASQSVDASNAAIASEQTASAAAITSQDARDAAQSASITASSASAAAVAAQEISENARDDAIAIAGSIGPIKFFDTYADAVAGIATIPEGWQALVLNDETRGGSRTQYKPVSGSLEFTVNLDQLRIDLSGVNGADIVGYYGTTVQGVLGHSILSYAELASAQAAAATLPDGQLVYVQDVTTQYLVENQELLFVRSFERAEVNFRDYGAEGDGIADDTAAVTIALNQSNKVINGGGRTYRLTSEIQTTGSNLIVRNATFDLSGVLVSNGRAIQFSGAFGVSQSLTSDALAGSETLGVGSTAGFSTGGFALLRSNLLWSNQDSKSWFAGQIVRILSVDSETQVTLAAPSLYNMTVTDAAFLQPLSMLRDITFENCTFKGKNVSPYLALCFQLCADARVVDCRFLDTDYAGATFEYCADSTAVENEFVDATGAGSSYGIMIANACTGITASNNIGRNLRHLVTIGGQRGVCTYIDVDGNKAFQCRDAGIDSHAAGDYVNIRGNHIEMASGIFSDGIIFQGANNVITGNTVVGGGQKGIYWQNRVLFGKASGVISNNLLKLRPGSGIAIAAYTSSGCEIDGLSISGNILGGAISIHIHIYAAAAKIRKIALTGNVALDAATAQSCYVTNLLTHDVIGLAISGNIFKCAAGTGAAIAIDANSVENAARIYYTTISGNVLEGGLYGIDADYCTDVRESGNVFVANGSQLRVRRTVGFRPDMMAMDEAVVADTAYVVPTNIGRIAHSGASALVVTLPDAPSFPGREIWFRNTEAFAVTSDANNVIPITGLGQVNVILSATDGDWCLLKSNGASWVVIARRP